MTQVEQILQSALALPPADGAFVAAALERSLDQETTSDEQTAVDQTTLSDQEFLNELERRWEAYRSGATTAGLASDVLAEQYREQADEESK